ncbi:hypothetical protein PV325_014028, partial [Microctonus aethiopoides]
MSEQTASGRSTPTSKSDSGAQAETPKVNTAGRSNSMVNLVVPAVLSLKTSSTSTTTNDTQSKMLSPMSSASSATTEQTVVPSGPRTRSKSPTGLSAELVLKVRTQMSRLTSLGNILTTLPTDVNETSLEEIAMIKAQAEEIHKAYISTHQYLEGDALNTIKGFPMDGEALNPSWDALIKKYENKRLLIQWELDKLTNFKVGNLKS